MKAINILLIEDNEGDILLTKEAFEEYKILNKVHAIKDGKAALSFFEGLDADSAAPNLVLLDINLPKISGHEILTYIKTSERFKHIPVIMLTTSSSKIDMQRSYESQADCYLIKPLDIPAMIKCLKHLKTLGIEFITGK